jgi:hypothetical protein
MRFRHGLSAPQQSPPVLALPRPSWRFIAASAPPLTDYPLITGDSEQWQSPNLEPTN